MSERWRLRCLKRRPASSDQLLRRRTAHRARGRRLMAAVLAALLASVSAAPKVFILIGQSNMEGHGLVLGGNGTLEYAVKHHPSGGRSHLQHH